MTYCMYHFISLIALISGQDIMINESSGCVCVFRKSPGEGGMEVVPPIAARPSLRDMHSPQAHAKSTIEEDVKRHSAPDSPPPPRRHKEKVCKHLF